MTKPKTFGDLAPSKWPGERLGLPEKGRSSIARAGRRIGALVFDWLLAVMTVLSLFPAFSVQERSILNLGVFALLQIVFIPTIGGSLGHRLFGMRIAALDGRWVGLWKPIVRTLLLLLVVPALVWDSDQRAFHDKVAGTVLIRG